MINGILMVNKPINYTSRDVVNVVSKILKTKKMGHTGTLDPLATGLLILTVGNCTKISELLTAKTKEYIAEVKIGIETDTLDITGKILKKEDSNIIKNQLEKVLSSFIGSYEQEVPLYSAVKINGKKLYEYARNSEVVDLPKKMVTIYDIKLLEMTNDGFKFKCVVSKGTYIRSLIRDICYQLGIIGSMKSLARTKQGNFDIENAYSIDEIKNSDYKLLNIDEVLEDVFIVNVDQDLKFKIKNGQVIDNIYNRDMVLFKDKEAIALYKKENDKLKPYKMFL